MIELFPLVLLVLIYGIIRIFHLASSASTPQLYFKKPCSPLVQQILDTCPILNEIYLPTLSWGKSGHIQTVLYAKMGRVRPKSPKGKRHYKVLKDGATMSFDVYEPFETAVDDTEIVTLCVCPGLANSSEARYIRTLVTYAQTKGYRVTVLNHLGALLKETLTAPRIFTYGGTEEYGHMVDAVIQMYPTTKLLAVGLSMGGNIVVKYLGEDPTHQQKFLGAMSICQGYEINKAKECFLEWAHFRRLYCYGMTIHMKSILRRHSAALFSGNNASKYDLDKVFAASTLADIDDNYSSLNAGYHDINDYYKSHSSAYFLEKVKIPLILLNSLDDPLVPPPLLQYPHRCADKNPLCLFVTTKHGGHLGFFENGYLIPDEITWLDRAVIQFADSIRTLHQSGKLTSLVKQELDQLDHISCNGTDHDRTDRVRLTAKS